MTAKTPRAVIADWLSGEEPTFQDAAADADYIIAALSAAGFAIAPRKPTEKMVYALYGPPRGNPFACKAWQDAWADMLAAAESDDGK